MPCIFYTFDELLKVKCPEPSFSTKKRKQVWTRSGNFFNDVEKIIKSFLCESFNPVVVGNVAGKYLNNTYTDDVFPQFTLYEGGRMEFYCELCEPYNTWCSERSLGKKYFAEKMQGCRQLYEHYISSFHNASLEWWQRNEVLSAPSNNLASSFIPEYAKVTVKESPKCLFLWDQNIVVHCKDDLQIRRVSAKKVFQTGKRWKNCKGLEGHKDCKLYSPWKKLHPEEHKELCMESSKIQRSVYIEGSCPVVLNGKTVIIKGGIKSLDPACVGYVSSGGNHPYTCSNCWKQRPYLKDLLEKRKKAKLLGMESMLGMRGFKNSYSTIKEMEKGLVKVSAEKKSLQ